MAQPERSRVTDKVLALLRSRGARATKIHGGPRQATMLDIVACYKGLYLEIECKVDDKATVTNRQSFIIEEVKRARGIALRINSVEEMKTALHDIDIKVMGLE